MMRDFLRSFQLLIILEKKSCHRCFKGFLNEELLKAKIHLHLKMTLFDDHFLMKKKCVRIHYSLKNEILKKNLLLLSFFIYQKRRKKENNGKKRSAWVEPCLKRRDALEFYNTLQLTTHCNTLQRPINTSLPSKCK